MLVIADREPGGREGRRKKGTEGKREGGMDRERDRGREIESSIWSQELIISLIIDRNEVERSEVDVAASTKGNCSLPYRKP